MVNTMFHVKHLALLMVVIATPAYAWNQDQSQNAVAKQHQAQTQHQVQRQGQKLVNAPTTNVTVTQQGGGVGGAGSPASPAPSVNFAAPAWSLPSIGASGMDCPTVGISGGGSGPMGGGGIGPSWISPDCNARKLAELLYNMGHPDIAMKVLADQYPVVRDAAKDSPVEPPAKPISTSFNDKTAWCNASAWRTWSRAEQARNPGCNH